jgi:hypothetical protein
MRGFLQHDPATKDKNYYRISNKAEYQTSGTVPKYGVNAVQVQASVADLDQQVFRPTGSGSGSICQIWIRILLYQEKIVRKTLIPDVLLHLYDLSSFKMM